jgi:fatty-acyl-CoA synthase
VTTPVADPGGGASAPGRAAACGLQPPDILFKGRTWTSHEVAGLAAAWHARLREAVAPVPAPMAIAMVNHPESVALFFACSALPRALLVLGPDPRGWPTTPPIPPGTPLALLPSQRDLAAPAQTLGLRPVVLDAAAPPPVTTPEFFSFAGTIILTSGSTGLPKPVFRSTPRIAKLMDAMLHWPPLSARAGVIGALPLSTNQALGTTLLCASAVGGRLALLERFDHRSVLALFATREYELFSCTPFLVDVLSRCPIKGPTPPAPACVKVSAGFLAPGVFRAFRGRFGVAPRQSYGSTEGAVISTDTAPAEEIDGTHVGWPAPGVHIRIGDDRARPVAPGATGRIWYVSPWHMDGYGFPPDLAPTPTVDGWIPTSDLGVVDERGCLTLLGRVDDRFKTVGGRLVNPEEIAAALRRHPAVVDAAVVPLAGAGNGIGALVVTERHLEVDDLRRHAEALLPGWARPDVVAMVTDLPLLPSGKVDRDACIARLRPAPPVARAT